MVAVLGSVRTTAGLGTMTLPFSAGSDRAVLVGLQGEGGGTTLPSAVNYRGRALSLIFDSGNIDPGGFSGNHRAGLYVGLEANIAAGSGTDVTFTGGGFSFSQACALLMESVDQTDPTSDETSEPPWSTCVKLKRFLSTSDARPPLACTTSQIMSDWSDTARTRPS